MDEEKHEVSGTLAIYNRGAGFIRFQLAESEEVCLFRPNRLYVDGQRVPANQIKTLEAIGKIMFVGEELRAVVKRFSEVKTFVVMDRAGKEVTLRPAWYAHLVWKGDKMPEVAPPPTAVHDQYHGQEEEMVEGGEGKGGQGTQPEIIIDNVPGRIILNQLATLGRRSNRQTLISFKNPEGEMDIAMFRFPRLFFMNGKPVPPKEVQKWDRNYEIDVKFTAVFTPGMKEFVFKPDGKEAETAEEMRFMPHWRAKLIWVGEKPTEEMLVEVESEKIKSRMPETVMDMIQGCEYLTTRVEKILNKNQGILTLRNNHVMFHIENLSIDGQKYTTQEDLLDILQPGETLFTYARALSPPYKVDGFEISHEAVQVWKGRKNFAFKPPAAGASPKPLTKKKVPLPSDANHRDVVGTVLEIQSASIAYVIIKSDDPSLRGQKVLLSRNRLFVDGVKLRYKHVLGDFLHVGDTVGFDMVEANPEYSLNAYNWIATLAWQGTQPNKEEVYAELQKRTVSYRGKILILSRGTGTGADGGVIQIIGGFDRIGEKVLFSRTNLFIYGLSLAQADINHIIKLNDKVQLEIADLDASAEEYHEAMKKYQTEIKYVATSVWIGNSHATTGLRVNLLPDDPFYSSDTFVQFIQKRGLTPQTFQSLVAGQLPVKCIKPTPEPEDPAVVVLPPNVTFGKVVELKRNEATSSQADPGVEHGIVKIENGPYAQEKAFFHRSSLFCWGYNCARADLMYLILDGEPVRIEVQGGTNNKAVPCKVTSAWIGPHKSEKNKESVAMAGNAVFMIWLQEHSLSVEQFHRVIRGDIEPKLYFPLAGEPHQARLASLLYTHTPGVADAGILRLCQNPANSKDGRKAPEVLFDRDSFYLWNVSMAHGDLGYVMNQTDKYFVEVTDLVGKEKRRWQTLLGTENIPKFVATIVYVGGGRPKAERLGEDISSNTNLKEWLKKRNLEFSMFELLVKGKLPPKPEQRDPPAFTNNFPLGPGREQSPSWPPQKQFNPPQQQFNPPQKPFNPPAPASNEFRASVLNKAILLVQRTMMLTTPEDPEVQALLADESDAQLALFLSKTLNNALCMYRQAGPGAIGPPCKPGPIGPPTRRGWMEQAEFYTDSGPARGGMSGNRGEGLYGLAKPLLDYPKNGSLEPPFKRKFEDW